MKTKQRPYTGIEFLLFSGFLGINNNTELNNMTVDDSGRIELVSAENFEINNDYSISTRKGRKLVVEGATHSVWSSGKFFFVVINGTLYRMFEDETFIVIANGIGNERLNYEFALGKVYIAYSGGCLVVTDSNAYSWGYTPLEKSPSDTRTFGFPSPFTKILWHSSRMFVAKGNVVYQSVLFSPGVYDLENYMQFPSNITDWVSTRGGIYLATESGVHFLSGADISSFSSEHIVSHTPIAAGSMKVIGGSMVGNGVDGDVVVWVGKNGELFFFNNSGSAVKIVDDKLLIDTHGSGCVVHSGSRLIFSLED